MFFGALGGIIVMQLVGGLRAEMDDAPAFVPAGIVAGLLGAVPVVTTGFTARERRYEQGDCDQPLSSAEVTRLVAANRPFIILISAMLLITVANVLFVKSALYLFERILKAPEAGAATMAMMTAAPLAAAPVWTLIFRRIDKRPGLLAGCGATTAGFLLLLVAGEESPAMSSAAFAGGFWSILPDTIDFGQLQSGSRIESSLIGVVSAVRKIGIAAAGVRIGLALEAAGYDAARRTSAESAATPGMMIALAPIAVLALGAAAFLRYPITAERHRAIIDKLSKDAA